MSNVKKDIAEEENGNTVAFTIRVDQKLFDDLNEFTKDYEITRSSFVRLAIKDKIKEYREKE